MKTATPEQSRRLARNWLVAGFAFVTVDLVWGDLAIVIWGGRNPVHTLLLGSAVVCVSRSSFWCGWLARGRGVCGESLANAVDPTLWAPYVCTLPAQHSGRTHTDGTASWTPLIRPSGDA